jgi:hypothetical protein
LRPASAAPRRTTPVAIVAIAGVVIVGPPLERRRHRKWADVVRAVALRGVTVAAVFATVAENGGAQ